MSKKICLIIDSLGAGGAERAVLSLAQGLSNLNCRVDVIVLSDVVSYKLDEIDFNVYTIKRSHHPIRLVKIIKRVKSLRRKIADIGVNYDLIVANLPSSSITCKLALLPNLYYCIHSSLFINNSNIYCKKKTWFLKVTSRIERFLLMKWLYRNQNLITVSHAVKDELLLSGIKPKTIKAIYNSFDFESIRHHAEAFKVDEQDYIVHVGRFCSIKRHDILIKAYKKSGIGQKLLLLGDYNNETGQQIKRLVAYLGLQKKVIFIGFNDNPYPYIKNSKALILSSDYESLSMVLIESIILKTPVASTDCIGPSEILIDELKQFLSPINDINALAENIEKVVNSPIELTDKYINKFDTEISSKQYLELCK